MGWCCFVIKSCPTLATLWTVAHQTPLSMGFPRQEYWSGLPFPSSGDLPNPGTKPASPAFAGGLFTTEPAGKSYIYIGVSNSLQPHGLYSPWKSPGQNTGVGSHSLLQGIFLIQRSNPGLLHCRWILYHLSHQGSPYIYINIWLFFSF